MSLLKCLFFLLLVFPAALFSESEKSLTALLKTAGISTQYLDVLIEKTEYRLTVLYKNQKIKSYPVVFGFNPTNDKRMEGDGCTPEGIFYMKSKYQHRSWSKFIWINYPTADSRRKHQAAKTAGEIPGSSTIGGEIGIHGVPDDCDSLIEQKQNWTLGCISLTRKDVDEIYPYINLRSRIEIRH